MNVQMVARISKLAGEGLCAVAVAEPQGHTAKEKQSQLAGKSCSIAGNRVCVCVHTLTCLGDTTQMAGKHSPWYLQRNLVQAVRWTHWGALEEARGRQRQVASGVADTFEDLGAAPLALLLALLFDAFLALVLLGTLEIMQAKEEH